MTTVLDALRNAQINFQTLSRGSVNPICVIANNQLANAIEALENGMQPDDVMQESLGEPVVTKKVEVKP